MCLDRAAVEFHQRFADRESEAEAAELLGMLLSERFEDSLQGVRLDSQATVTHFHNGVIIVGMAAHPHVAALRRKFDGILEHVPKRLLYPSAVRVDAVRTWPEINAEMQTPRFEVRAAHVDGA